MPKIETEEQFLDLAEKFQKDLFITQSCCEYTICRSIR